MNIALDPETAAAALREAGYTVTPPAPKQETPKETDAARLVRLYNSLPQECCGRWPAGEARLDFGSVLGIGNLFYPNAAGFRQWLIGLCMEYIDSNKEMLDPCIRTDDTGQWGVVVNKNRGRTTIAESPDLAECLVAACKEIAEWGGT